MTFLDIYIRYIRVDDMYRYQEKRALAHKFDRHYMV